MQKPGLFGMNGFIVFLLICHSFAAQAQEQRYMILLDAENKQPFVVRVGDQSYFSSGQGHLVLSQLKDSTYKLGLRFPRKNITEQIFTIAIHRKDLGFQLSGNDSLVSFINWQTKDIIRPVYEKDSSRLLERGIKKDDGFSRLMAAVVNDTAVMYNTYAGNGFGSNASLVNALTPNVKVENAAPDITIPGKDQQSVTDQRSAAKSPTPENQVSTNTHPSLVPGADDQNNQPANFRQQPATINRDSLLVAKRMEMHLRDSLNTVQKTAARDSLITARKQQNYLRDSLNTARKTAVKDSMILAKKRQVFLKDSLSAARKNGASEELLAAKRIQLSKDSLAAVNRETVLSDSLLAVSGKKAMEDSIESLSGSISETHHSSLTQVKKLREVSLKISRKMVFLDIAKDGRADTITLFVYYESTDTLNRKRSGGEPTASKKPFPPDSTGEKKSRMTNNDSDSTGLSKETNKKNTDSSGLNKSVVKKNSAKPNDAPQCSQSATESDTEALRSAILKANTEQEKIAIAAGAFAMKCFSVTQVRFLASLLVSDKAKYGLMDAAHLHVIDRDHFPELVDMLTDRNFQRKFLVMAEKRS